MLADDLRTLQAPLKDRYRADATAAEVTLSASGTLDEGISCSVKTGQAIAAAGLHPASGGDGSLLCSGDMLLEALVACAGVTLRAVATSLEIAVAGGTVSAEGDIDFRGTLGVSKEAPVGLARDPPALRPRHHGQRRAARDAAEADRALLRGAADARQQPRAQRDDGARLAAELRASTASSVQRRK